jgi:hypothetical protein
VVKTENEECVLFKLAIHDVAENFKLPVSMRAKPFIWLYTILVDHAKVSPLLITRVIVTG